MERKIGYSNLDAFMITLFVIGVSMTFGIYVARILLAYVSASFGCFIFVLMSTKEENRNWWPWKLEALRAAITLFLFITGLRH